MRVDLFDFALPGELIAQRPASPRDSARLLEVGPDTLADHVVRDLPGLLSPGDLLVFNDTRVIPARLLGLRAGGSGGRQDVPVEAMLIRELAPDRWLVFVKPAKRLRTGDTLAFANGLAAEVTEKRADGSIFVTFNRGGPALWAAIEHDGAIPLPPYIRGGTADDRDKSDYQTLFARHDGSVAAPTAGLHFTPALIEALAAAGVATAGVTLHVGAGTFLPVRSDDTDDHLMHAEWGEVPETTAQAIATARSHGGRIVSIGTTSLRLLESVASAHDGAVPAWTGETDIFITPGFRFRVVDLLVTNFHLPRSTLFMLVAAFAGLERMRAAYAHAIAHGYRFYSYGDGSLLHRNESPPMSTSFDLLATDGAARRGRIGTAHGTIETPAFMPVGTVGTVKAMLPESVAATGAEIVLGNTFHLMLRPGPERMAALGGLHKFMNWPGPILTDSGGFQVMSLAKLRKLDPDGVTFRSPIDGSEHRLTPERSIEIQHQLDADITMSFDECTAWPVEEPEAADSMRMSMRWAARGKQAFVDRPGYGLFGIVQGSTYPALRAESVAALTAIGFDGYAVGGLAVGEGQAMMFATLDMTLPLLPADRPRYLMGVGRPSDIVGAVKRGIDMFDCVMPSRAGRTAKAFTPRAEVNLRNARHRDDPRALDENCACPACRDYSRAYLHHLVRSEEVLGAMLLTWHNLHYYQDIMRGLRGAIEARRFDPWIAAFEVEQARGDIPPA